LGGRGNGPEGDSGGVICHKERRGKEALGEKKRFPPFQKSKKGGGSNQKRVPSNGLGSKKGRGGPGLGAAHLKKIARLQENAKTGEWGKKKVYTDPSKRGLYLTAWATEGELPPKEKKACEERDPPGPSASQEEA